MTRLKMIGLMAMAGCAVGYGGAVVVGLMFRLGHLYLSQVQAVAIVTALAIIGEIGLWIGAGCLGLTIFKRRKALFDRVFRRKSHGGERRVFDGDGGGD